VLSYTLTYGKYEFNGINSKVYATSTRAIVVDSTAPVINATDTPVDPPVPSIS